MIELRPACPGDLADIAEIYNEAILNTVATFDTEIRSEGEMRSWYDDHGERYPMIVCLSEGATVGYASLIEYSPKKAYAASAVVSVYIESGSRGNGYGRSLLAAIIDAAARSGFHSLIARITEGNDVSVHLFESFGFEYIGRLREVGTKFGRLLDVDLYQKILEDDKGEK
jgi:phosphinothricin acetyltransferase